MPPENQAISSPTHVTADAADFIARTRFEDLPSDLIDMALRCITDTTGLFVAGLSERSTQIIVEAARDDGGRPDAMLLGTGIKVPAQVAARAFGIAAHAHDFDDTQVSHDPAHIYGLLTHPSAAPLSATLAVADMLRTDSAAAFLTAFCVGFEVSCKISEWMLPDHYRRGHHSSGTVATFGAAAAAAHLLELDVEQAAHALGIASAMAAGIRANFGTMSKPLHVGRASENGVLAALLAQRGFTADPQALDGRWGFASVLAGGYSPGKPAQGFGRTWSMLDPGVSIKPYPSGILTHQAMDMVRNLVSDRDIRPDEVERIDFFAGSNILDPIRYDVAENGLQAKFSMAALIAMLVLFRRAGIPEFEDDVVRSERFQAMQRRIRTHRDDAIDKLGFDVIRSRIDITLKNGTVLRATSDPRYRGGPSFPMTQGDLEEKFRSCAHAAPTRLQDRLLSAIAGLGSGASPAMLLDALADLRSDDLTS
ncbi:MAG: MmgE/PrpD family protein [Devosia sp.]|uniref:MmgE/PrpD family protein n=1 Tax=Devosia sp. TaxID=1871048 RepID=UPI001A4CAB93|nr:MmgE/PrpD family protein [Devosia sp.]MBL8600007.1 MmgE/PrpD family protein [Devosia sp.]